MKADDVTDTLNLALKASGCDSAKVIHKPRLLSDNGSSYISGDLVDWLDDHGIHERKVATLAGAIAEEMGLSKHRRDGLLSAALVHDIGKLKVPMAILNRPGRLTEPEFELIKVHSKIGFEILMNIDFPWPVANIVHQHHERMDGSGYPNGLLGDAILLEARILAVADSIEAMASHRP